MSGTVPDWLFDLRAWLRAHPDLSSISGRVFFDVPDSPSAFPLLRVYASGGVSSRAEQDAPLFDARCSIEVWGSGRKTYQAVRQLSQAVQGALIDLQPGPLNPPSGTTYCTGAAVTAAPDLPAPDSGDPRIVIDCVVTIRAHGRADP